jgi:hypothetical protein
MSARQRSTRGAQVGDGALRALRVDRSAEVLPVLDQKRVDRDPVPLRDGGPEGGLRLFRGLGLDDAEPVRDPVDVGVDRHPRDPVPEDEDAVGRLRPDAGERGQFLERPGDDAPEPVEDLPRAGADRPGLRVVEPGLADQRFDLPGRRVREAPGVGVLREQPGRGGVGVLVPGPLREDRPDQHLERVLGVVAEVRDPPVARVVERAEAVEERFPVERSLRCHRPASSGADPSPGSERSGSSVGRPSTSEISSPTR